MFDLMPRRNFPFQRDLKRFEDFFDLMNFEFPEMETRDIRVDIREDEKKYVIEAELPGVDKDDIKLEIADNVLCLEVEQDEEKEEKKDNYIRRERRYGSFKRSFYIDDVDLDEIEAELEDGILEIELGKIKPEKGKKRLIDID